MVTPSTRFMVYSVTKGLSAAVLAREIDESAGRVRYSDAVGKHWPEFAAHGKERVTIADALSHRAGLRACSLCPVWVLWLLLRGRFVECMTSGIDWIAKCTPSWRLASGTGAAPIEGGYARYHPTSWSWIAGGIYQHVARKATGRPRGVSPPPHIRDGAADLARQLGFDADELAIGLDGSAPPPAPLRRLGVAIAIQVVEAWWRRLAVVSLWPSGWSPRPLLLLLLPLVLPLCLALALLHAAFAYAECAFGVAVGNSAWFGRICLPSSNGMVTARALGAVYGALANGGQLADGTRILSAEVVAELRRCAADEGQDVGSFPPGARLTCGFSPWLGAQVEANVGANNVGEDAGSGGGLGACGRLDVLGHTGMGGCCAYADLSTGLAVCVLKNAFSPESLNGFGPGRMCALVDVLLRRKLELTNDPPNKASLSEASARSAGRRRPSRSPGPQSRARPREALSAQGRH